MAVLREGRDSLACDFVDTCTEGGCLQIRRAVSGLTSEEFAVCGDQVIAAGRERGFSCFDAD